MALGHKMLKCVKYHHSGLTAYQRVQETLPGGDDADLELFFTFFLYFPYFLFLMIFNHF